MKIAIVGANGQVGTEVALRLRGIEGVEVIPIVRNASGSAYLRWQGMKCRHGLMADPSQARELLHDCDVVVNFSLSTTGIPSVDRKNNYALALNAVGCSRPGARIVFSSTIMVYAPATATRIPDAYGLDKLAAERITRQAGARLGRQTTVLRLGHVLGPLQNITRKILNDIQSGPLAVPERWSNSVFTASIAECVMAIAQGKAPTGTFDMISDPQWSWRKVYEHHAAEAGLEVRFTDVDSPSGPSLRDVPRRALSRMSRNQGLRERLTWLLGLAADDLNKSIQLRYLNARAHSEIAKLRKSAPQVTPDWRELKPKSVPGLSDPVVALERFPLHLAAGRSFASFEQMQSGRSK